MTGIYQLEINKKLYIGSSIHVERRIIQHKSDLKRNRHDNPILQNAYNKYKTITVTILKKLDDSISNSELRKLKKNLLTKYTHILIFKIP